MARLSSGSLSVQVQIVFPYDSDSFRAASAATTAGCVTVRRAQAVCPTAAPGVIRVWWISHARGL